MQKKGFILFIGISILMSTILFSCKRNHVLQDDGIKIIKIDTEDKGIGNPIKITEVIPLETSKDCLVGYVEKAVFWNNRIMIIDEESKTFFSFDESGKLKFKTIIGKGPGEVMDPTAFNIDTKDTTILLYQQMIRKFSKYDFSGRIIDSRTIMNLFIKEFFPLGVDTFLIYHSTLSDYSKKDERRLTTYSLFTDGFSKVQQFDITVNKNKATHYVFSPVSISSGRVLFVAPWSYNIFELIGNDYRIKYALDFGKAAISAEQREVLSTPELIPLIRKGNKIGCLLSVISKDDLLIISTEQGNRWPTFIHSWAGNRTINLDNYIQRGLLPKCRVWGIKENGCLYALVEPEDFMKFNELHPGLNHSEITINSNPVLISFPIDDLF